MSNPLKFSYVDETNNVFEDKIYPHFFDVAFFPYRWAYTPRRAEHLHIDIDFGKLLLGTLLAPILVPATIVTFVIALCLAAITALCHALAFLGATIADAINPDGPKNSLIQS